MITRFIEAEAEILADICRRVERLGDDPVQRVLNILELYADALDNHPEVVNGCLYASVALQRGEFSDKVTKITREGIDRTLERLRPYFEAAVKAAPPRKNADVEELVNMVVSIGEGAIIMSGLRQDPSIPGRQFRALKAQLEILFGR